MRLHHYLVVAVATPCQIAAQATGCLDPALAANPVYTALNCPETDGGQQPHDSGTTDPATSDTTCSDDQIHAWLSQPFGDACTRTANWTSSYSLVQALIDWDVFTTYNTYLVCGIDACQIDLVRFATTFPSCTPSTLAALARTDANTLVQSCPSILEGLGPQCLPADDDTIYELTVATTVSVECARDLSLFGITSQTSFLDAFVQSHGAFEDPLLTQAFCSSTSCLAQVASIQTSLPTCQSTAGINTQVVLDVLVQSCSNNINPLPSTPDCTDADMTAWLNQPFSDACNRAAQWPTSPYPFVQVVADWDASVTAPATSNYLVCGIDACQADLQSFVDNLPSCTPSKLHELTQSDALNLLNACATSAELTGPGPSCTPEQATQVATTLNTTVDTTCATDLTAFADITAQSSVQDVFLHNVDDNAAYIQTLCGSISCIAQVQAIQKELSYCAMDGHNAYQTIGNVRRTCAASKA
ncbi:Aste57867_12598 [Aphanomyces stellatus]|uniref:Aste57867_12598 protein n=1 Tax=Aphanomyces stellatus TaxID=120398 RepID=A0A485KWC5_9STRA|nr:hypothetical protein As57867_012552 [Aphanomyces stellatus]VFT89449.1 Aste57867_12598 [Aphanomyces stellatus]